LKNSQLYEVIPIELFIGMKNLQKIVKVAYKTMLQNFISLNVYFKINLKGESFDLGQHNIWYFHNSLFLEHLKNYASLNGLCAIYFFIVKIKIIK